MPRDDDREYELYFKRGQSKYFIVGLAIVVVIILLSMSVTLIPAGHVGLKDFFGKISDTPLAAGIHLVNPLVKIRKMSVQTVEIKESADVPSQEGLVLKIDMSLLSRLIPDKAAQIYKTVGRNYVEVIVEPQLRSVLRGITASYDAKALYTAQREVMAEEIQKHLAPLLEPRGVMVEKILLRTITLPKILATAIERKLEAEQQAEQMRFVLDREKKEAERKVIEAQGIANFQRTVASGITPMLLEWKGIEATEKLVLSQNAKVIVVGNPSKGLPIIFSGQ